MKSLRKTFIFLILLVSTICLIPVIEINASTYTLTMINGAQIRTAGVEGLRFEAYANVNFNDNVEHGFYVVRGKCDYQTLTNAIENKESTVLGNKLVSKTTTGNEKSFAVTVFDIPTDKYSEYITSIAYAKENDNYIFSNLSVTRNLANIARSVYNDGTESEFVKDIANTVRVKVENGLNEEYYSDFNAYNIKDNDVVDLVAGTYESNMVINASNVIVNGANKDTSINNDGTRTNGKQETIIPAIVLKDEANNVSINGLEINGAMFTENNSSTVWDSGNENNSNHALVSKGENYGAGILVVDDHTNIEIKNNKFDLNENVRYGIVDNCENNISSGSYKLNTTYNSNYNISNNYFNQEDTIQTNDIFFRSYFYDSTISSNYFKNNNSSNEYDSAIKLWRMGRVNTDNTTISVTNNTINHLNSGYGIDLGFAAFADTIQTIDVMNNIINSSNKGLRVSFLKNGATVNILKNIITVNDGENNYNMVLSTSSKADNLRDYSPRLYVTNNSFKGNVKIGITVKGDKVGFANNYFENGAINALNIGTVDMWLGNGEYESENELNNSFTTMSKYYQDILINNAFAYKYQGTQIQYDQKNSRRNINSLANDATAYRSIYLDCSSFCNSVYKLTFGIDILEGRTPGSQTTANIDTYARDNVNTKDDVICYYNTDDYTTTLEKSNALADFKSQLQVGDLIEYRHNSSTGVGGHIMLYIGNDEIIHCTGSSFTYDSANPLNSTDGQTSAERTNGGVAVDSTDILFKSGEKRYLFTTGTNKVTSFCIIRPFNRNDLVLQSSALNQNGINGLSIEKTSNTEHMSTINKGDEITYNITLKNNVNNTISNIKVFDKVPSLTTYKNLSVTDNGVVDGENVSWNVNNLLSGESITLSYTVTVNNTCSYGDVIDGGRAVVNGVLSNKIYHTVGRYSKSELDSLASLFTAHVGENYSDGFAFADSVYYEKFNSHIDPSIRTTSAALDALINVSQKEKRTDTDLSLMLVSDLYGGLEIRNTMTTDNDRIRLVKSDYLQPGDIILTKHPSLSEYKCFIYVSDSLVLTVEDGVVVKKFIIASSVNKFLTCLIAYNQYAVLRPSLK